MSHRTRPPRAAIVFLASLLSTLWGAAALATAPSSGTVALAERDGPSYAQDSARVQPLSLALVGDVLGSPAAETASTTDGDATTRGRQDSRGTPHVSDPGSSPDPSPGSPQPQPDLGTTLTADKSSASPGEGIHYTLTVTNRGDASATDLTVSAHRPPGTTLTPPACSTQGAAVGVDPGGEGDLVCLDVGSPEEGSPEPSDEHAITFQRPTLRPGASVTFTFVLYVRSDAQPGSVIVNHSHAEAGNHGRETSEPSMVTVR